MRVVKLLTQEATEQQQQSPNNHHKKNETISPKIDSFRPWVNL